MIGSDIAQGKEVKRDNAQPKTQAGSSRETGSPTEGQGLPQYYLANSYGGIAFRQVLWPMKEEEGSFSEPQNMEAASLQ